MDKNLILINANSAHIRIAQLTQGVLSNLHWENRSDLSQVGAIYKAQVIKNQPGIEACFINVGLMRSAFLYTGKNTFNKSLKEEKLSLNTTTKNTHKDSKSCVSSEDLSTEGSKITPAKGVDLSPSKKVLSLKASFTEENLKQGQKLIVQVVKDGFKGKSQRVSCKISLPGLYLVYLPTSQAHIGISRQITDEHTREKLMQYAQKWDLQEAIIIRTKAAQATLEELKKDLDNLKNIWKDIQKKYEEKEDLGLIWSDFPLYTNVFRNFLTDTIQQVFVDNEPMFLYLQKWAHKNISDGKYNISWYNDQKISLFDKYDLEPKIKRLLKKRVRLKSGGFIVIEETEAAVIIDVNTGSFIGKKSPAENILKTNLEAAKEISIQIRLRNCGGIILIDFIDMEVESVRQQVMDILDKALKEDPVPTELFPMSDLSIIQITRKRIRPSLLETVCKPCSHCGVLSYY